MAEAICYGGTFDVDERKWLKSQDFVYKEFDLSWDIGRTLLDAGLPFTLVTSNRMNNHLQAVIGYDLACGTFYLMDPSSNARVEVLAKEVIEMNAHVGPRCLVFVPSAKQSLLADHPLPAAQLYLESAEFGQVLDDNKINQAQEIAAKMAQLDASHRLTLKLKGRWPIGQRMTGRYWSSLKNSFKSFLSR